MVGTKVWCLFDEADLRGIYTTKEKALAATKEIFFEEDVFFSYEEDEAEEALKDLEDTGEAPTCGFFLKEFILE
jgi:hypothetical protein